MTRNPNPIPPRPGNAAARRPPAMAAAPGIPPQTGSAAPAANGPDIIARPARYYRTTRYIMVVVLLVCAGWFAFDGWHTYPSDNQHHHDLEEKANQLTEEQKKAETAGNTTKAKDLQQQIGDLNSQQRQYTLHSAMDIGIQRVLTFALPLAAAFMLWWALHNSRDVYRLSGDTLQIPGHPPVKLAMITRLDKSKWDRKGIAYVEYRTDRDQGRLRLDDFIYERDPTDAIYKKIDDYMTARGAA